MKKALVVAIMVCYVSVCVSCKQSYRQYFSNYDSSAASDIYIEEIIRAIKDGNEKQICDVYATNTVNELGDITQSAEEFINYIQGDIMSYTLVGIPSLHSEYRHGKVQMTINGTFEVVTDNNTYYIAFLICTRDDECKENIGIESMFVIDANDWKNTSLYGKGFTRYGGGPNGDTPGIHIDLGEETFVETTTNLEDDVDTTP